MDSLRSKQRHFSENEANNEEKLEKAKSDMKKLEKDESDWEKIKITKQNHIDQLR